MATFPTLANQQETNRKILEELQLKKQLIQKGGSVTAITQMPTLAQPTDFPQSGSAPSTTLRSVFNQPMPTTLGYFIQQDSFYGNAFLPVLPRLDPTPPPSHHPTK